MVARSLRTVCGAAVVLLISSVSSAQSWRIDRTLEWSEVYVGTTTPVANPNGVFDSGESALLKVSATFSPPVGSLVVGVGPTGEATVAGLAQTAFSLSPVDWEHETGSWEHPSVLQPFSSQIFPVQQNIIFVAAFQEPQGGAWLPSSINPIPDLFQIVWTPESYEPRYLDLRLGALIHAPTQLWARYGTDPTTGNPLLTRFNLSNHSTTIQIPVSIPSPGPTGVLLTALVAATRRDRSRRDLWRQSSATASPDRDPRLIEPGEAVRLVINRASNNIPADDGESDGCAEGSTGVPASDRSADDLGELRSAVAR